MSLTLFDLITILGGVLLLVAPDWAYNFGRAEHKEIPPKWRVISRVAGIVFILLGVFFIYRSYTG